MNLQIFSTGASKTPPSSTMNTKFLRPQERKSPSNNISIAALAWFYKHEISQSIARWQAALKIPRGETLGSETDSHSLLVAKRTPAMIVKI